MAIRTPRPPTRDDPTLISSLIGTFQGEQERQRVRGLEQEERERLTEERAFAKEGELFRRGILSQDAEIRRRQDLRSRGFEEIGSQFIPGSEGPSSEDIRGALEPPEDIGLGRGPESPLQRQRPSIFGIGGEGVQEGARAGAVRGRGARQQAQDARREREGLLEPGRPQGPQFTEGGVRRIQDPSRDPSIVNPSLIPQPPPPQFDFSTIENDFGIPPGSLQIAFNDDPNRALGMIIERQKELGEEGNVDVDSPRFKSLIEVSKIELNNLQSQLNSITQGFGTFELEDEDVVVENIIEKMNNITRSLVQILIGPDKPFDAELSLQVIDLMFPDLSREERIQMVTEQQEAEFADRVESSVRETGPRVTAGREFLNPIRR